MTFGSFNNPAKVTPAVVAAWAEVLRRVPRSRLVLKYQGLDDGSTHARYAALFAALGIDPARVDLLGKSPHAEMLDHYNRVDLALDTFPYSGGLTTCEALWMGVPVVTFPGGTFASRHSLSHLSNVGLTETIAVDLPGYVDRAVSLAGDLPRLDALRAGLRAGWRARPCATGRGLRRTSSAPVRAAWREWVRGTGGGRAVNRGGSGGSGGVLPREAHATFPRCRGPTSGRRSSRGEPRSCRSAPYLRA